METEKPTPESPAVETLAEQARATLSPAIRSALPACCDECREDPEGAIWSDAELATEAVVAAGYLSPEQVAARTQQAVDAALGEVERVVHHWETTPALRRGMAAAEIRRALNRARGGEDRG